MELRCPHCDHANQFEQPYPYNAGFSEHGFLYNDAGNATLVWHTNDPLYVELRRKHSPAMPWALTAEAQTDLERRLPPSPKGDRWRFSNPARCEKCRGVLSGPMVVGAAYFIYPGSVVLDLEPPRLTLSAYATPVINR